jgi:phosphonate transport system substrate-binding protein
MLRKFICVLFLLLSGCSSPSSAPEVIDLYKLQALPTRPNEEILPLRVSVAAVISPQGSVESYQALLTYLSQTLNRPVELVQRRTYQETNELIEQGLVDLAFVCTSAYISGHDEFGMEILVVPEVNGESLYHSLLIVPINSPAQSMEDLQGVVFAFTDPISFTGRVYPSYLVHELGSSTEEFFSRTFFTYSHDEAIYAVAEGLADGAAIDSLVYEFVLARDPDISSQVRIIHESQEFGIPPVVISPHTRPQQRVLLQEILLNMDQSVEGRTALANLGIERFVVGDDAIYNGARQIISDLGNDAP